MFHLPGIQSAHKNRDSARRGGVLIAVLAIIALLSFLVTRFLQEASDALEYRALFNEPPEARAYAFSMLEASLAVLHEVALIDDGKLYAPEQGWSDPIAYCGIQAPNGWSVSVEISDATAKLPLNTIEEKELNRILEQYFEFDFGITRELSSMLLDWIDSDDSRRLNGAESEDYLDENPPYRAANSPLQSLEELRLLKIWQDEFFDENGRPNETFAQLASIFTVKHRGSVNANSAPLAVFQSLAPEDDFFTENLFDQIQDDTPYLKKLPDSASDKKLTTQMELLRITVTLTRGSVPFVLEAVVEPQFKTDGDSGGGGSLPGAGERDRIRSGTLEEQDALKYPYRIVDLNTGFREAQADPAARYSAVDIDR
jgi:general secretion pathway protein K